GRLFAPPFQLCRAEQRSRCRQDHRHAADEREYRLPVVRRPGVGDGGASPSLAPLSAGGELEPAGTPEYYLNGAGRFDCRPLSRGYRLSPAAIKKRLTA